MNKLLPLLAFSILLVIPVGIQNSFAIQGQGTLYATEPFRCELWTIDPSDGSATFIANTADGGNEVTLPSLAVHPFTGVMYAGGGGGGDCSSNNPNLYIVNPSNGDLTLVGATNVGNLVGLDFRSDGTLFAAVNPGGGSGGTQLGIVNTATGDTTIVGSFGVDFLNGIAFLGNTLYGVGYNDELYTINTSTGDATVSVDVFPGIELGAAQFACDGTFYVGQGSASSDFGILDILSGIFNELSNDPLNETMGGMAYSQTCSEIAGELLQIDSTVLMVAGLHASAIWMIPALVGVVGIGAFYIKTRINKE